MTTIPFIKIAINILNLISKIKKFFKNSKRLYLLKKIYILYSGMFLNVPKVNLNLDMKKNLVSKNAPTKYFNNLKTVFGYLYYFIRNKICILSKQIFNILKIQRQTNYTTLFRIVAYKINNTSIWGTTLVPLSKTSLSITPKIQVSTRFMMSSGGSNPKIPPSKPASPTKANNNLTETTAPKLKETPMSAVNITQADPEITTAYIPSQTEEKTKGYTPAQTSPSTITSVKDSVKDKAPGYYSLFGQKASPKEIEENKQLPKRIEEKIVLNENSDNEEKVVLNENPENEQTTSYDYYQEINNNNEVKSYVIEYDKNRVKTVYGEDIPKHEQEHFHIINEYSSGLRTTAVIATSAKRDFNTKNLNPSQDAPNMAGQDKPQRFGLLGQPRLLDPSLKENVDFKTDPAKQAYLEQLDPSVKKQISEMQKESFKKNVPILRTSSEATHHLNEQGYKEEQEFSKLDFHDIRNDD